MKRRDTLEHAINCVCKERQDQHGNPENSFQNIADYWNVFLEHKINKTLSLLETLPPEAILGKTLEAEVKLTPADVATMMVLLKVARAEMNPLNNDNFIDMCGYASLAGELHNVSTDSKRED